MIRGDGRTVTVACKRVRPWLEGFQRRHGPWVITPWDGGLIESPTGESAPSGTLILGADGTVALLSPPTWLQFARAGEALHGELPDAGFPDDLIAELLSVKYGVVLIRRAGFAAAVISDGAIVGSKVGRRYVQGQTAAGGWSQQRYARRRANQADDLVEAAAVAATRILMGPDERASSRSDPSAGLAFLATGGDRPLLDALLRSPRLAGLPRGPHLGIGNPDRNLVDSIPDLMNAFQVTIWDSE